MKTSDAVDEFLRAKRRKGATPATLRSYARTLRRFVATAPPVTDGIDRKAIERYVDSLLDSGLSENSVATYCREAKVFCRWLRDEELVEADPWARVDIPKAPTTIHDNLPTEQDFARLVAACDQRTLIGRRDVAILHFLYETGCRVTEMCTLREDDVELDLGRAKVMGKGRKERFVFFGNKTAYAIQRYRMRLRKYADCPELFVSRRFEPLNESSVRQMLSRLKEKSGVECAVNPHAFRHAFATAYLRNGGDLHSLQRLLGHASLAIVTRYLSLVTEDLEAKHRSFGPLRRDRP